MKISDFVATITSGFSRNKTVEVYTSVIKEMGDTTIPMLEQFAKYVAGEPRAEKVLANFGKSFLAQMGGGKGKFYDRILVVMRANVLQAGEVEDLITSLIPKDADAQALDGRAANLVQYIEILAFVNRYLRQLLLSFTADITKAVDGPKFDSGLAKPELERLQQNLGGFVTAMNTMELAAAGVERAIKEIPEFNVAGSDHEVMAAAHGVDKLDPLRMGFFSARWNPIIAVRTLIADRLIARYNAAKEERQALEYRLQALLDSRDGTNNPQLEKAIQYHTGRLKQLNYEIEKIEERAR